MRGRKPKPTATKRLAGNPGKRKMPADEPEFSTDVPDPPDWMDGEALDEWNRVVPELKAANVAAEVYRSTLVCYCQAWSTFVDSCHAIARDGATTFTDKGCEIPSPWVGIQNKAMLAILKFATEYGLTASSKARIKADKKEPESALKLFRQKRA